MDTKKETLFEGINIDNPTSIRKVVFWYTVCLRLGIDAARKNARNLPEPESIIKAAERIFLQGAPGRKSFKLSMQLSSFLQKVRQTTTSDNEVLSLAHDVDRAWQRVRLGGNREPASNPSLGDDNASAKLHTDSHQGFKMENIEGDGDENRRDFINAIPSPNMANVGKAESPCSFEGSPTPELCTLTNLYPFTSWDDSLLSKTMESGIVKAENNGTEQ